MSASRVDALQAQITSNLTQLASLETLIQTAKTQLVNFRAEKVDIKSQLDKAINAIKEKSALEASVKMIIRYAS